MKYKDMNPDKGGHAHFFALDKVEKNILQLTQKLIKNGRIVQFDNGNFKL